MLFAEETKNLTETKLGAKCQGVELTARDGTIAKMKEQLKKVTGDSTEIKELRKQRTMLRNKVDEQIALRA